MRNAIGDTAASSEPLVLSLSALGPDGQARPDCRPRLDDTRPWTPGAFGPGHSGAPKDMAVAHRRMGRMGDGQWERKLRCLNRR